VRGGDRGARSAGTAATDVVIVGGGPVGLATAIGARLAGLSARVVERAQPPVDKACGEGLMPDAVERLTGLGVEIPAAECSRFRGIRYIDGEVVAEGAFPGTWGLGARRLVLHRALAARAEELGAEIWWGTAALGLESAQGQGRGGRAAMVRGVVTDRGLAAARWVVGADGLRSRVRGWVGLEVPGARARLRLPGAPAGRRLGMRRHFAMRPWSDLVEVYWGPGCEAYVTPTAPGEVGVAVLWGEERGRRGDRARQEGQARSGEGGKVGFPELLANFPALAERLAGARAASSVRGCGPMRQRVRGAVRGNVALVGDAAGYLDAITGEGIAVGLHQAAALVAALAAPAAPDIGGMAGYAAEHARIGRLPDAMTSLVLGLERRPWLRRRAIRALAAEPTLFSRLLGISARAMPPAGLGFDGAIRLAYRLVTP
jgi:menaquinone-9 beta-reductase